MFISRKKDQIGLKLSIFLILFLVLGLNGCASFTYFEDFSNTPQGQVPVGCTPSASSTGVLDSYGGRTKVMRANDPSGSSTDTGWVDYTLPKNLTGVIIIEYKYRWDYYYGASLKYYNLMRDLGHTPEIRVWINDTGHSRMGLQESILLKEIPLRLY